MKKAKKHLLCALILALLLSMSAVPAAASGTSYKFSTYERLQQKIDRFLTATYDETTFKPANPKINPVTVKSLLISDTLFSRIAAPDQEYEVINTGSTELTISILQYVHKSASGIREEYAKPGVNCMMIEELPEDDTPVWFAIHTMDQRRFLTNDGVFASGYSSADNDEVRKILPGETVTFTLPDAQYGSLYRVFIEPEGSFLRPYYIFIADTKAIPGGESVFSDVPDSAYFSVPVEWAVRRNITTGMTTTTFAPGENCTKAQILTFLWRTSGCPASAGENPFADVSEDKYYRDAAIWAYENGLVDGEVFDGSAPCTRAMTVMYLWKLAGSPAAQASSFADVDSGAEYAAAVGWAVEQGITNGTSETEFSPDMICTRGQIVTLLCRATGD